MIGDSGQADEVERVNLVIRSDLKGGDGTEGSLAARLHVTPPSPPITPPWLHVTPHPPILLTELQKRADRADQSVLFFLAGANFWEKHAKNRRKHAKTGEKQALFWC